MNDIENYYKQGNDCQMSDVAKTDSRVYNLIECAVNYTPKNGKLLDLGCGDGYLRNEIKEVDYTGLDISNNRYKDAVVHDLAKTPYPFKKDSFDTILCSEVLEHLWSPEKAIEEIYRCLKPGGYAVVTVPNFDSIDNVLNRHRVLLYTPTNLFSVEHIRLYNPDNLKSLFSKFELVEMRGNSQHMVNFFYKARQALQNKYKMQLIDADVMLGHLFPDWSMGLLMVFRKVLK